MKSKFAKAKERILDEVKSIKREKRIPIDESFGFVSKDSIVAERDIPEHDISIRDGYAIRSKDLRDYEEYELVDNPQIEEGECKRVDTGEKLPEGADTHILVEDSEKSNNDKISFKGERRRGKIIKKGSNIKSGEEILSRESKIDEFNIGVFPTLEIEKVKVYEKGKIGIISTGDEITSLNDVNSRTITGIVSKNGGEVKKIKRVNDEEKEIKEAISSFSKFDLDLIVTLGGTSKGKKDLLAQELPNMGRIIIDEVSMRPGKTFKFARVNDKPIFCLSGMGTPCIIQAQSLLVPALRKMNHLHQRDLKKIPLNKKIDVNSYKILGKGFLKILPARDVDDKKIEPIFEKYTTILPFLNSDYLMFIGEDKNKVREGEKVEAIPL